MAPKAKPKAKQFHPVVFTRSFTMSGGYCPKKKFVPTTRDFEFICGGGVAAKPHVKECVLISHREAWLCEVATGQVAYQRPMARVRIVRELSQQVAGADSGADAGADAKMAALAFNDSEDESSDDVETPVKKNPETARRKRARRHPRSRVP